MLETLGLMGAGFLHALTPINILAMAASTAIGIIIGCLPGLSAAMGVALLLPMTFTMSADTGRAGRHLLRRHLRRVYFRYFDPYPGYAGFRRHRH